MDIKLIWKGLGLEKDLSDARDCYGKRWWLSKTLWANTLAFGVMAAQYKWPQFDISADEQATIVSAIIILMNILLRFLTNQPVVATKAGILCNPAIPLVDTVTKEGE